MSSYLVMSLHLRLVFRDLNNHQPVSYVVNKAYVEGYIGSMEEADEELGG